ncbi:hypothetical protein ACIHFD_65395 [Nonomuraea sp. NPDC051941]|uniref:hypothetical protein n=1 Tax=Nonomuraea sp. NPDC051941 TaxID=3364373 RepID=UPI0037C9BDDF
MVGLETISSWRTKIFVWIGLPAIAIIGLVFSAADVVPAWQANAGNGTLGTFTPVHEDCGRRSCSWYGDFTATEGGAKRADVILYDEPDGMAEGKAVPARDTGARNGVFSTTGGYTWLLTTGLVAAGAIAAVAWIVMVVRLISRRRTRVPEPA